MSLEEVEEEGLLVSWTFSQQPQLYVTVSSMKIQRKVRGKSPLARASRKHAHPTQISGCTKGWESKAFSFTKSLYCNGLFIWDPNTFRHSLEWPSHYNEGFLKKFFVKERALDFPLFSHLRFSPSKELLNQTFFQVQEVLLNTHLISATNIWVLGQDTNSEQNRK